MKAFLFIVAALISNQLLANCVNFSGKYKNDENFILKLSQTACKTLKVEYKNIETGESASDKITIDGSTCHNFIIFPTTHTKYQKKDLCVKYQFDKHMLDAQIFSKRKRSSKYKLKGNSRYYRDSLAGHKVLYELYTGYKSVTDLDMNAMFDIRE